MFRNFALICAISLTLFGCASVPMGDAAKDAELKSFTARPGMAGL